MNATSQCSQLQCFEYGKMSRLDQDITLSIPLSRT